MSKKQFMKSKYKFKEWVFSEPSAKEKVKIKKQTKAMRSGKVKSIPLGDLIRKLEKMPPLKFRKTTSKEHHEIMADVKKVKSGKLKMIRVHPIK